MRGKDAGVDSKLCQYIYNFDKMGNFLKIIQATTVHT